MLAVRYLGPLATLIMFLVNQTVSSAAFTLDTSKWFFGDSVLLIALPIALACYGFYVSRGGEPLLGRRILD